MGNTWIWIPFLVIVGLGLFYFGYKGRSKGLIRTVIEESLRIAASFFFALFGFSMGLFDPENEKNNSSEKA